MKSPSRIRLLATPWTAAYQAPLSMGFSRQEYWSGLPLPSPSVVLLRTKAQETASWNIKRFPLSKENHTSQVMNLVLFYVWKDSRVSARWNQAFDKHLNSLRLVSCLSPSWVPLGVHSCTEGSHGGQWWWWYNILYLLKGQTTFFVHRKFPEFE